MIERGWLGNTLKRLHVETFERPTAGKARRERTFWLEGCTPLFFVSVASKGLTPTVSLLFATLAGRSISVAAKGLTGEFLEAWQGRASGDRKRRECPLPPAFL